MPLSIIVHKKVWDFKFKQQNEYTYAFYLTRKDTDILIGQVFKLKGGWSAVSHQAHRMNNIAGFKTRVDAAEYMLKLNRYTIQT